MDTQHQQAFRTWLPPARPVTMHEIHYLRTIGNAHNPGRQSAALQRLFGKPRMAIIVFGEENSECIS